MEIGGGLGVEVHGRVTTPSSEEEIDVRRGPWTVEEDLVLINYIASHGEGRWNSLARCAGLRRTGKSCRLRWLNYLRPDVRRGNITPEEQLLILELHSRWGNRWSKIAQQLPGRTDNEIKNYWRTRVQKHAKQLKCDVNSKQFQDVMRYLWMPRLLEKIRAANSGSTAVYQNLANPVGGNQIADPGTGLGQVKQSPESSCAAGSSWDSVVTQLSSPISVADCHVMEGGEDKDSDRNQAAQLCGFGPESVPSPGGYGNLGLPDFDQGGWWEGDLGENLWSVEDIWFLQQ